MQMRMMYRSTDDVPISETQGIKMTDPIVFYQHCNQGEELVFSGRFEGSPVPNFTLFVILDYYRQFPDWKIKLVLRNGVVLSVIREKGYRHLEVAQLVEDKLVRDPRFRANDYGIFEAYENELVIFIQNLVMNDHYGKDMIWGI